MLENGTCRRERPFQKWTGSPNRFFVRLRRTQNDIWGFSRRHRETMSSEAVTEEPRRDGDQQGGVTARAIVIALVLLAAGGLALIRRRRV